MPDTFKQTEGEACACGSRSSARNRWIWALLAVAIAAVLVAKNAGNRVAAQATPGDATLQAPDARVAPETQPAPAQEHEALPRLIDLGATKCIPCKMMAPILEELKKTYAGKLEVQFIDVWENPDAGKQYEIGMIPTQIFYDATGKELFRHEGFLGREDILAKWKEFGVDLAGTR